MAEIIKCYEEHLPALRLIGKRYTDSDRGIDGSFGNKWGEWFGKSWFVEIEKLGVLPENGNAYLGVMRCINDSFEYWIGMFFPAGKIAPIFANIGEYKICPLFCGFSYRWKTLNEETVDNIIEILKFIDEIFAGN